MTQFFKEVISLDKYISDLIKPEDMKIETSSGEENGVKFWTVKLTVMESGINETVSSEKGQISAFNLCLKNLEKKYLLDELDTYKRALETVKFQRDCLKNENEKLVQWIKKYGE